MLIVTFTLRIMVFETKERVCSKTLENEQTLMEGQSADKYSNGFLYWCYYAFVSWGVRGFSLGVCHEVVVWWFFLRSGCVFFVFLLIVWFSGRGLFGVTFVALCLRCLLSAFVLFCFSLRLCFWWPPLFPSALVPVPGRLTYRFLFPALPWWVPFSLLSAFAPRSFRRRCALGLLPCGGFLSSCGVLLAFLGSHGSGLLALSSYGLLLSSPFRRCPLPPVSTY